MCVSIFDPLWPDPPAPQPLHPPLAVTAWLPPAGGALRVCMCEFRVIAAGRGLDRLNNALTLETFQSHLSSPPPLLPPSCPLFINDGYTNICRRVAAVSTPARLPALALCSARSPGKPKKKKKFRFHPTFSRRRRRSVNFLTTPAVSHKMYILIPLSATIVEVE